MDVALHYYISGNSPAYILLKLLAILSYPGRLTIPPFLQDQAPTDRPLTIDDTSTFPHGGLPSQVFGTRIDRLYLEGTWRYPCREKPHEDARQIFCNQSADRTKFI